ncbi:Uncharacterised protein [Enterobacter asburiae]|nr:Uncharacterised protein [Enterobacter asburiae]
MRLIWLKNLKTTVFQSEEINELMNKHENVTSYRKTPPIFGIL